MKKSSNKLWRGKYLVNRVLNPKNECSSEEDDGLRQHIISLSNLNQNPDPSFTSTSPVLSPERRNDDNCVPLDNVASPIVTNILAGFDEDQNEVQHTNHFNSETLPVLICEPSDSSPIPADSQNQTARELDNDLITPEDLDIVADCNIISFGVPSDDDIEGETTRNYDVSNQLDTQTSSTIDSSRSLNTFKRKKVFNENIINCINSGYSLKYQQIDQNINLKNIAQNYASDSSCISSCESNGDFSATEGSDYVPSGRNTSDSSSENAIEDNNSLLPLQNTLNMNPEHTLSNLIEAHTHDPELLPDSPSLLDQLPVELGDLTDAEDLINESLDQHTYTGRPSRGRKRKCPQNRDERKAARNKNEQYYDYKKRVVVPKKFIDFKCKCKKNCQNVVPIDVRKKFFSKFWSLGNYNSQTNFLGVFVQESEALRQTTGKKQYSRKYSIEQHEVCRDMFCRTLTICSTRISTAMQKLHSRKPLLDQRGLKQAGKNCITDDRKQDIREFIDSIPLYTSHYCRTRTSANFFKPGLTLAAVYDQYKERTGINAVSFAFFKEFFYSNYNIKVKNLSKDTCNVCDGLRVQKINAERRGQDVEHIKNKKKAHLDLAEEARRKMKADMNMAKDQANVECLTFDMEKTLPLPRLQTNLIFYKRQLWLYNLGVRSAKNNQSYCYVWVEGQAGRGAQEVGSCLLKHINNNSFMSEDVKHLILWSDSCGGQNRNIKITLLMKAALEMKPHLESITFKFLMPGHSYLPNDKDFGDIERALKYNQRIYTPQEYIDIMRLCKKNHPMIVCEMKSEDFHSTENLEKNIINRKKTVDNKKVNWLLARQIKITKSEPFKFFMRPDFSTDEYDCIDVQKKIPARSISTRARRPAADNVLSNSNDEILSFWNLLTKLWPNGKPIAEPKLRDLLSIRHLIPGDAQLFYDSLTGSPNVLDDVDGFNTNLDFLLEDEVEG